MIWLVRKGSAVLGSYNNEAVASAHATEAGYGAYVEAVNEDRYALLYEELREGGTGGLEDS